MKEPKQQFSYTQAKEELDAVVARLEDPSTDIATGAEDFSRGMQLISELQQYLQKTQNKVEKIKKQFGT